MPMGVIRIDDLPEPVLVYIFSYLSPYRDLKQCKLVCKSWYRHIHAVVKRMQREFNNAITTMSVQWDHLPGELGPTISKRYSHSACCHGNSMYIFGGCTTANTTFNDLWRLDLATRYWIRPLATGTYPPPKACATLVCFEENLILFGGWTHTSPYPLHQVWRIFNQLHMYNTSSNRWTRLTTSTNCPAMAGHSATVQGHLMVVFGGLQRISGEGPFSSSSDIWILDLRTMKWRKQTTTASQPLPRYGHSQISLDDKHILIMGGCGGPNMLFSDIWLLTMTDDPLLAWEWKEITIHKKENAAPHLAFHPACKVGSKVVVLSKTQKSRTSPSSLPHLLRAPSRLWMPPRTNTSEMREMKTPARPSEVEQCVNGKRGVLKRQFDRYRPPPGQASSSDEDDSHFREMSKKAASSGLPYSTLSESENMKIPDKRLNSSANSSAELHQQNSASFSSSLPSTSSSTYSQSSHLLQDPQTSNLNHTELGMRKDIEGFNKQPPRSTLSIRPNARRNRQRQIEGLDRMEQRLKDIRASNEKISGPAASRQKTSSSYSSMTARNPMCLYVMDISTVIDSGYVTWLPLNNSESNGPEEIILYSLIHGRGEIVMFGGIQKDLNSRQQEGESMPEVVSNSLHFMSAHRSII